MIMDYPSLLKFFQREKEKNLTRKNIDDLILLACESKVYASFMSTLMNTLRTCYDHIPKFVRAYKTKDSSKMDYFVLKDYQNMIIYQREVGHILETLIDLVRIDFDVPWYVVRPIFDKIRLVSYYTSYEHDLRVDLYSQAAAGRLTYRGLVVDLDERKRNRSFSRTILPEKYITVVSVFCDILTSIYLYDAEIDTLSKYESFDFISAQAKRDEMEEKIAVLIGDDKDKGRIKADIDYLISDIFLNFELYVHDLYNSFNIMKNFS